MKHQLIGLTSVLLRPVELTAISGPSIGFNGKRHTRIDYRSYRLISALRLI